MTKELIDTASRLEEVQVRHAVHGILKSGDGMVEVRARQCDANAWRRFGKSRAASSGDVKNTETV